MGTPVRASAAIKIDEIDFSPESMRIGVKLSEVKLALLGESDAPVATLIKSGALDLSKPGNLVKFLPKRPPAIVEADGDRIVVDLMKVPAIADNSRLRRLLAIVTPVINVRAVETDRDHIYVALKASPRGLPRALAALRRLAWLRLPLLRVPRVRRVRDGLRLLGRLRDERRDPQGIQRRALEQRIRGLRLPGTRPPRGELPQLRGRHPAAGDRLESNRARVADAHAVEFSTSRWA